MFSIIIIKSVAGKIGIFFKQTLFKTEKGRALVIAYFYLMGIIFHALPFTRPIMLVITPYFILTAGGVVFYFIAKERRTKVLLWCAGTFFVTYAVEVIGVKTGKIFGPYHYGTVLGPKILETPLIIGFNWLLVIIGLAVVSGKITRRAFLAAGIVGFGAFLFDFILEPTALSLGYWTWHARGVPIQNYLAWFGIAYSAALVYHLGKLEIKTELPVYYVAIQTGFFLVMRFIV